MNVFENAEKQSKQTGEDWRVFTIYHEIGVVNQVMARSKEEAESLYSDLNSLTDFNAEFNEDEIRNKLRERVGDDEEIGDDFITMSIIQDPFDWDSKV